MFASAVTAKLARATQTIRLNRATQQPPPVANRPIFRSRPDLVNGTPVLRLILPFRPDRPIARFHENENPYFFRRAMLTGYKSVQLVATRLFPIDHRSVPPPSLPKKGQEKEEKRCQEDFLATTTAVPAE